MRDKQPKEYDSPTTPGLKVSFNDFIVELVCLNMDARLCPRFWCGNNKKYWGPKYGREISRGISNLLEIMKDFNLNDQITRIGLIRSVQQTRIQTLLNKKNVARIFKRFKMEIKKLNESRTNTTGIPNPVIDEKANSTFVDPPQKSVLGKIRSIEANDKD